MKKFLLLIFAYLLSCGVYAQSFDEANSLYAEGKYNEALQSYLAIAELGQVSSELYYNLGNTYYRLGLNSKAILNYERALRLDPQNADAKHNLEFVKQEIVDKIDVVGEMFFVSWYKAVRNLFTSNTWAYFSIVCFVILLLGLIAYIFARVMWLKKTGFSIAIIAFVFSIIGFIFSYQQKLYQQSKSEAIVLNPTVTIKSSPDASGTDLFILHEGTKVFILDEVESWLKISIEDGNNGWLEKKNIEII